MTMTTRRPHRKSRLGCRQCKKNRTKCDEQRPSCSRCTRIGVECSLLDPTSTLLLVNRTSEMSTSIQHKSKSPEIRTLSPVTSSTSSIVNPFDRVAEDSRPSLDLSNYNLEISKHELCRMKLLKYYIESTARTINELTHNTPVGMSLWQEAVLKLALKTDYLLHCLLGISALHVALRNPEIQHEYGMLAIQHHSRGLALYTPHLSNVTAENIDALFGFACLTALYSFGIHHTTQNRLTPLVKVHEVFTMIRGSGVIVKSGIDWLHQGIWADWFRTFEMDPSKKLHPELEAVMAGLRRRVDTTITTSSQSEMYHTSIESLRQNFVQANILPRTQMSLVMFPIFAPPEFLQMVCIGEPLALAILANWGVILHWLRGHLWVQDWGAQTVKAVREVLPSEWHSCISWAIQKVGNTCEPVQLPTPIETEQETPQGPGEIDRVWMLSS